MQDPTQQGHVNTSIENGLATIEFFSPDEQFPSGKTIGQAS